MKTDETLVSEVSSSLYSVYIFYRVKAPNPPPREMPLLFAFLLDLLKFETTRVLLYIRWVMYSNPHRYKGCDRPQYNTPDKDHVVSFAPN